MDVIEHSVLDPVTTESPDGVYVALKNDDDMMAQVIAIGPRTATDEQLAKACAWHFGWAAASIREIYQLEFLPDVAPAMREREFHSIIVHRLNG